MTRLLLLAAFFSVASLLGATTEAYNTVSAYVEDINGVMTYVLYNNETLKQRDEISTTNATLNIELVDSYIMTEWQPGYVTGKWLLFYRDSYVTIDGCGYFRIRWESYYWEGKDLRFMQPTFTVNSGTFLEVAGGGTFDNTQPKAAYYIHSEYDSSVGFNYDNGMYWENDDGEKMDLGWQNKFYYLNGSLTIMNNERRDGYSGAYNLAIAPWLYSDIVELRDLPYGYLLVYDTEE